MSNSVLTVLEKYLLSNSNITSAMYVGSSAKNLETCHDFDVIVLFEDLSTINKIILDVSNVLQVVPQVNIDVVRFAIPSLGGREISLALRENNIFKKDLLDIINGDATALSIRQVNWAVGGYFPELLFQDVIKSKIIFDRSDWLRDFINNYSSKLPESLKIGIYNICMSIVEQRLDSSNNSFSVYNEIARSEIVISLIRLIFISQNLVYPGSKHLNEILPVMSPKMRDLLLSVLSLESLNKTKIVELYAQIKEQL